MLFAGFLAIGGGWHYVPATPFLPQQPGAESSQTDVAKPRNQGQKQTTYNGRSRGLIGLQLKLDRECNMT